MSIRYDDKFVKTPGMENEYTSEMISDLVKCSEDVLYFLNFVTIVTIDGGRKKLGDLLYPFQKKMIKMCKDHRYLCFLFCRQSGKSTTVGAFALWYAIFHSDKFIGIASNKASSAKDLLRRIKIMYEELPFYLKPGVIEYNKQSIEFENGSKIETAGTTEDTFRGRAAAMLLLDETAFVSDGIAREFYTSIYPTISSSEEAKIIIISTPNGVFNLFHEIYSGAEAGRNEYKHMKVTWDMIPGRTKKWRDKQIKNMGNLAKFKQEFEVEFLGSSNTLVSTAGIEFINTTIEDPQETDLNDRLRIYHKPRPGEKFLIGVDPSKGSGAHDASIQIYRIDSFKPVKLVNAATFQSNTTDTYELSSIINRLSIYYNDAVIGAENNAEGSTVTQNLWWIFENPNLYNSGNKENEIGIRATSASKTKAVITMKKLIEDGSLIVKDRETAKQISTFIEKNGKFASSTDGGDDLVSGLYWMCYLIDTELFEDDVDMFKNKEEDEDVWGILSDIDDDYYIEESSW